MVYFLGIAIGIAGIELIIILMFKSESKYKSTLKADLVIGQLKFISEVVNNIMPLQKYKAGKSGLRQITIYERQIKSILVNGKGE